MGAREREVLDRIIALEKKMANLEKKLDKPAKVVVSGKVEQPKVKEPFIQKPTKTKKSPKAKAESLKDDKTVDA